MRLVLLSISWCLIFQSAVLSQTAQLPGDNLVYHSTGASAKTGTWTLDRDGYLGTYITLAAPGNVTVNVQAEGTASGGVDPNMNVVIADTTAGFDVAPGIGNYSHTYSLPAGTFFVRTELNNDLGATPRQLQIDNLTVTGATISNISSNENALAASDTYIANYRKGNATINASSLGLTPGTSVGVSLKRIAFDFGAAVHDGIDPRLGTAGTVQQTSYQSRLNQNFNAIATGDAGMWINNEATQNQPTMADADELFAYAKAHNMNARLHNMLWEDEQPTWVNSLKSAASTGDSAPKTSLRNAITSRIGYYIGDGPGGIEDRATKFNEVDVYNESYNAGQRGDASTYWNIFGVDGIAGIYNQAKQAVAAAGASTKLFVNDYYALEDSQYGNFYTQHIDALRQAALNDGDGSVVGGIGLQFYRNSLDPAQAATFIGNLQNMNVEGLPTKLTEFGTFSTVTPEDSATIMGQAMRLMFGNPGSTGFINWYWTKEDGGATQFAPNAALYTVSTTGWNDWTLTPAGKLWQDMLGIQDWDGNPNDAWTTQLTTTVGSDGTINFNGYYGDYQVTINGKTYVLSLAKGKTQYTLIPAARAAGDFNGDGVVNAADYILWRNTRGSTTNLAADSNGDGVVNQADYATWWANFGVTVPASAAGTAAAIPEPPTWLLAALTVVTIARISRRTRAA